MTNIKKGDDAPDFLGKDQDGNEIGLSDYKGRKLILFFYPKDNTPGCTAEVCNFRDNFEALKASGFELLGVSADSARKHQNFIQKFNLPFPLLVDTEKVVINKYGVWGPKKAFGKLFDGINRTTFIIDEQGKIAQIITKVDTKNHTQQILELLGTD